MPYKIVIDAGHGGADWGATYENRKEKDDVLNLAFAVGEILQNNGIKTLADFMAQTEETFSKVKAKKGMPYVAKYLKEQEHIRAKLEKL